MEPYIEFIGTLHNSGFWLVKVRLQGVIFDGFWAQKPYSIGRLGYFKP